MEKSVFYIDPHSYSNLEVYDRRLLQYFEIGEVMFFGNIRLSRPLNVKTRLIYSYSDKKGLRKSTSYLWSQLVLLYHILKNKPAIIHFQWFKIPLADYFLLKVIKLFIRKCSLIHTAHNLLPHNTGMRYFKSYKKIYRFVDVIIVHNQRSKDELRAMFDIDEQKIEVIPHGLLDIAVNEKEVAEFTNKIDIGDRIVFSLLGKLSKYKGLSLVVDTWQSYPELHNNNDILLIIAGEGVSEELKDLKKFTNVVIDNRFLKNEEFIGYLRQSNVVLLPYTNISQSGVLLTALNERKRVIVSDVGGLTEPLDITDIGWRLPELSKGILFETIMNAQRFITANKANLHTLVDWSTLDEFYNWKRISKLTRDVYEKQIFESKKN